MGVENSKSDDDIEREPQRNRTQRRQGRYWHYCNVISVVYNFSTHLLQRLYTEDEIYGVLQNQRKMFQAKQLKMQTRVIPSAPEKFSFSPNNTTVSRQTYHQTSPAEPSWRLPRSPTSASAGPSNVTPTSAGLNKINRNRNKPGRPTSRSRNFKSGQLRFIQNIGESSGLVNCVTCNGELSLHIYQCTNGHSSCEGCKIKLARCGNCTELITDMRNITLESTLADMIINTEERIKCPNAKDGCGLLFGRDEIQNHFKECPFNIISCPVMEISGDCFWKGTTKQLGIHFNDAHPKHREADVNKEMIITVIQQDHKVMHLVNIGFYKFLVHIRLDTSLNNIYMVTQYLGTTFSAAKWSYEWHVYNKRQPCRKFEYIDSCKSNVTPVAEIVNNNDCAVINMDYAKTFLDSGKLTYKFYIKKFDTNNNIEN